MSHGVLYYKHDCEHCKALIGLLQNQKKLNLVMKMHRRDRFPNYIKGVPSIELPDPKTRNGILLYSGEEAFNFVKKVLGIKDKPKQELMEYDPMSMGDAWGGTYMGMEGDEYKEVIDNDTYLKCGVEQLPTHLEQNFNQMQDNDKSDDAMKRKMNELMANRQEEENMLKQQMGGQPRRG